MKEKLKQILLVDDDEATNFLHEMILSDMDIAESITTCLNGKEALDYLCCTGDYSHIEEFPRPAMIFLDINMPVMNGWEFLEKYDLLPDSQKAKVVLAMLTTSLNPDDKEKGQKNKNIKKFITKPLSKELVQKVVDENFLDVV